LLYQIDLHALQSHTLQRHDTVFAHTQNDSNVFAHALQLIYITHTYTAKARLSFCTYTRLRDVVNRSIFCFIESIYMHRNHIHCKDTTQSLLIYTERQQRLCAHAATNIRHSHSHCEGTTQLLHIYTSVQRSKSFDFDFLIDVHALQYTQNDSNVFAHALQLIYVTYIHCKGMTQLLCIYTLMKCSKSIDFSSYRVDLHASQSHTLQRHDTIFAHIYRTTATSLRTRCN